MVSKVPSCPSKPWFDGPFLLGQEGTGGHRRGKEEGRCAHVVSAPQGPTHLEAEEEKEAQRQERPKPRAGEWLAQGDMTRAGWTGTGEERLDPEDLGKLGLSPEESEFGYTRPVAESDSLL